MAPSVKNPKAFLFAHVLTGMWLLLSPVSQISASAQPSDKAETSKSSRPNIVIFLSDDMGWEQAGYNGSKEDPTPAIDSIARDGVKLTQFYVQPVCSPTRACLMTGRYDWKNGMELRPTATSQHGMLSDERTLAEGIREAGYATWMVGKWHLGEWQHHHLPNQRGFDHHYGHYSALIDSFTHARGDVSEPVGIIPGYPVTVYGEKEEARYGKLVRELFE
ncbi:MAG: sulfatase-like hydrolase/transferase [Verrucomicrobia bacterium]|nr:sulfatase-like hydrolase/transferase [Verrucomicrobiota bacterium]MDA1065465.1 sulfatase-like hydrolase/transferase [Verrucomicrobiota bacterium]